jgi:hypothetical protein
MVQRARLDTAAGTRVPGKAEGGHSRHQAERGMARMCPGPRDGKLPAHERKDLARMQSSTKRLGTTRSQLREIGVCVAQAHCKIDNIVIAEYKIIVLELSTELSGKVYMVTGANTGIGRVAAIELAKKGAHVVLACRSAEKTQPVIDEILKATPDAKAEYLALDLADLASVRAAAKAFLERDLPLHVRRSTRRQVATTKTAGNGSPTRWPRTRSSPPSSGHAARPGRRRTPR